ncbi:MAG: hypothetical protein P8X55_09845 [Desulfosarcinaceae bacterium]
MLGQVGDAGCALLAELRQKGAARCVAHGLDDFTQYFIVPIFNHNVEYNRAASTVNQKVEYIFGKCPGPGPGFAALTNKEHRNSILKCFYMFPQMNTGNSLGANENGLEKINGSV